MDLERERINLSMKSLRSDPWENVLANYSIGQKVEGKVTNLTPFGAFVEIESGLEGLDPRLRDELDQAHPSSERGLGRG